VGVVSDCFGERTWEGRVSIPEVALALALQKAGVTVERLHSAHRASASTADILHLHFATPLTHRVASGASQPYVVTLHEGSRVSYLTKSDPAYPYQRGRWEPILRLHLLRGAAAVIALCEAEAAAIVRENPPLEGKVRVIPNGVDLARYRPANYRVDGPPVILSVGQLRPHKGFGFLLKAFRDVVRRGVDARLRIVNHRRDFLSQYQRLATDLGVSTRVQFVPGRSTEDLASEYSRAAIYVQPSLAEGAPITILEAMASGLPIVGTDVACVREQLGDAGVLVPPADHPALVEALYRVTTDETMRADLGRAAQARCTARFDIRSVAEQHRVVYEEVVGRDRVRRRRLVGGGYGITRVIGLQAEPAARRVAGALWSKIAPYSYARRLSRRAPPPM
jgi:glycosyltransferase involved in cell wall biosynthesis